MSLAHLLEQKNVRLLPVVSIHSPKIKNLISFDGSSANDCNAKTLHLLNKIPTKIG